MSAAAILLMLLAGALQRLASNRVLSLAAPREGSAAQASQHARCSPEPALRTVQSVSASPGSIRLKPNHFTSHLFPNVEMR
jgi:hypothetical protein